MRDDIKKYYDQLASEYDDNRFGHSYGKYIDSQERIVVNKYLSKNAIDSNLDLACGTGRFLDYANHGIDLSDSMIQVSKKKYPDKHLVQGSALDLPFENLAFKNVLSFHLMMHLDLQKMKAILTEVARVTQKEGLFIFDIPSAKRRNLTGYKSEDWHGGFQIDKQSLNLHLNPNWEVIGLHGICFFPIHRIPKSLRNFFRKTDSFLSESFLKEYASHLIFVLKKI